MLHSHTKADHIFYINHGTGFLVLLKYDGTNEKRHSIVDKSVITLDSTLMRLNGSISTSFISVSGVYSGKVRRFSVNDRAEEDDLFRQIFNMTIKCVGKNYPL